MRHRYPRFAPVHRSWRQAGVLLSCCSFASRVWLRSPQLAAAAAAGGEAPARLRPAQPPEAGYWEAEVEIKKSRFVARLGACASLDEARAFRRRVGDFRCSHNCWAAVDPRGMASSSDDGEPGGTAGMPMRILLQGGGLFGVVVVVTRYYGGIKLGTGGLVRAYSAACRAVVSEAEFEEAIEGVRLRASQVPASQVASLYRLASADVELLGDVSFDAEGRAEAVLWVPLESAERLRGDLLALARGEVLVADVPPEECIPAGHEAEEEEEEDEEAVDEEAWDEEEWQALLREEAEEAAAAGRDDEGSRSQVAEAEVSAPRDEPQLAPALSESGVVDAPRDEPQLAPAFSESGVVDVEEEVGRVGVVASSPLANPQHPPTEVPAKRGPPGADSGLPLVNTELPPKRRGLRGKLSRPRKQEA